MVMDNNIINNEIENVKKERVKLLKLMKKEQNYSAAALFLMFVSGILLSVFLPDITDKISDLDTQTKEILNAVYDGFEYCLYLGIPILFFAFVKRKSPDGKIGFAKKMPEHPTACIGFCLGVMYFANVLASVISVYFSNMGVDLPSPSAESEYIGMLPFAVNVAVSALLPAFLEEILMRGFVMGGMAKYDKRASLIISSVLFGLMHLNPIQNLFAVIAGLVIGHFVLKSGSLWFGIAVHFLNNFIALAKNTVLYSSDSDSAFVVSICVDVFIFIFGVVSAVYLIKKEALFSNGEHEGRMLLTLSDGMILYVVFAFAMSFMQISF